LPYSLGMDLGTTYSAAAIGDADRIDIFQLGNRIAPIPSVVTLREDGTVLVGEVAERRSVVKETRTAREFKRRLGDPTPILLGGTPYGAESLTARLLEWIVAQVSEQQGEPPALTVMTHPAAYGPYKIGFLEQAARLAGVEPVEFVTEPEAAAVHYSSTERVAPGELIAVYDFGGGTLDIAVVRKTTTGFELTGTPEGMERFGGADLDESIFGHVAETLGGALENTDPDDPATRAALAALRVACRDAKEALSDDTDVTIPVMLPGVHTEVRLTRAEFEDMIRPRLRDTLSVLERVVGSAEIGLDDVSRILLIGGASRTPLVAEMIRRATGRPVSVDAHPKHSVALGAAAIGVKRMSAPSPPELPIGDSQPPMAPVEVPELAAEPEPAAATEVTAPPEVPNEDRPEEVDEDAETKQPEPATPRRRVPVGLVGAVLAVVAVAAGLWAVLSGNGDEASTTTAVPTTAATGSTEPNPTEPGPTPTGASPVAAVYMIGFGTPDIDGEWGAWAAAEAQPPDDIAGDFYPLLDPYSSADPEVVRQHFDWLQEAGIGALVVPWPGPGTLEDRALPIVLETAAARDMGVMIAVEVPDGSPPELGMELVEHLQTSWSESPGWYRLEAPTPWTGSEDPRPIVFLSGVDGDPELWREVLDLIHEWPNPPVVIANSTDPGWVEVAHFDGLAGLGPDFAWAEALPENAWYVPSVMPGRSANRIGQPDLNVDRAEAATYEDLWTAAVSGRPPAIVVIESFNRWTLGTQIEPATPPGDHPADRDYQSYDPITPVGYLEVTRALIEGLRR